MIRFTFSPFFDEKIYKRKKKKTFSPIGIFHKHKFEHCGITFAIDIYVFACSETKDFFVICFSFKNVLINWNIKQGQNRIRALWSISMYHRYLCNNIHVEMTNVSVHQSGLCPSSTVVEHSSEFPKIEGLNPATFTGRYKMAKTYIFIENDTRGWP
jgi:hypothetical protein